MPGTVLPNLGLTGDIPDHATWGTEGRANDRLLDSLVMLSAKDLTNTPPSSPSDGDRYIVGPSPTGAWSGKAGAVAMWNAALVTWVFYSAKSGWSAYLEDERSIQRYGGGGTWFVDDQAVNVRRFGAVGDGVTDDTSAVVAALAATPAGRVLYFPKGTYLLSTWTVETPSKSLWLAGDGRGDSVLKGTAGAGFLSITHDFRCSDLGFDTWSTVFDFSAVSTVIERIAFDRVEIKNYNRGIYASSATPGVGVRDFAVRSCRLLTGTSYAIFFNLAIMEDVRVLDCVIRTCVQRAIDLGNNSLVFADDRGNYVIQGNLVDGVTAVGASAFAIIVYGWRAVITGNVVRNVSRDVPTATDCVGIYTKCRYSVIANNVLVDAGQAEGFINVKGGARGETVTQPYGFSVVVANNVLVDTQAAPTLVGGGRQTNGIKVATSEVLVVDNHLEGLTETGIYTDSDTGSDAPNSNIVIAGNTIKNHRGDRAIAVFGAGRRLRVLNNLIDTVDATFDPKQNIGIAMLKKDGGDVDIVGNRIFNVVNGGNTPVGIMVKPSNTAPGIQTVTNLRVADNHVDTATHGVQFTWDELEVALDDVLVRHNSFRNVTNEILYTDTPTNLNDIPVAQAVVREAVDDVAVYRGTGATPQEVRIYAERVDGSANYERLSLQCNATSARIETQFAGTLSGGPAAARPLEIGVAGNRWRVTTSGSWQPMTDNAFDFGGATARPRDVYVGRDLLANNPSTRVYLDYTNTATVGNVTINKVSGRVNVAAAATTVVVTNNRVTAASHVMAVAAQVDANGTRVVSVVPAAGSFTVTVAPAPAANMAVDFVVFNAD